MQCSELEYVGFWPRVGAAIIDAVLFCLISFPLLTLIYGANYWTNGSAIQGLADFIISWLFPAVVTIWFWVTKGQTPGKMAIGARVVDVETGANLTIFKSIVRYLAYFLSGFALCIGCIWIVFDRKKQGWHDHIAGTVVVRKIDRGPETVVFNG